MSALPMTVPRGMGLVPYAELSLMLPDWWKVDLERWKREPRWFWPVRELSSLARYPHRRRTWLGVGHTIANGGALRPFDPTTKLAAMLIQSSPIAQAPIEAEVPTELLTLCPIHGDELAYTRARGSGALVGRLNDASISPILDPDRPSCLQRVSEPLRDGAGTPR